MINWTHAALLPAARRIARHIQDEWGLWVGLATTDGQIVPFPKPPTSPSRPICQHFAANRSTDGSIRTCAGSVTSWVDDDEHKPRVCHVGLSAISVPIKRRGKTLAVVYASGFLHGEDAARGADLIAASLRAADFDASQASSWIDAIPRLDRRKRDVVHGLLRAIAADIEGHGEEIITLDASEDDRFGSMIGRSEEMQKLFRVLRRVSRSNTSVLIEGENGTGKELIARALHSGSTRSDLPLVIQNVAAIPAELIESELFGHKKGAFSGAHRDREGLFEMANNGTFFLDEIGEMTVNLQVKLLRVLQEGTFLPVGASAFRKVDVRMLCATNRELREEVKKGNFREDLFFRINVITITAPPLRHRIDDIPLLVDFFVARAALHHDLPKKQVSAETLRRLMAHSWPGNVRELENEIEKLVIMSGDAPIIEDTYLSLSTKTRSQFSDVVTGDLTMPAAVESLERHMILDGLKRNQWNKSQTARDLGVSRRNLIRKVADFGLEEDR